MVLFLLHKKSIQEIKIPKKVSGVHKIKSNKDLLHQVPLRYASGHPCIRPDYKWSNSQNAIEIFFTLNHFYSYDITSWEESVMQRK